MLTRIPTTVQVGCFMFLAAIAGSFCTKGWIESRTLRAVDMPVSLARGTVTRGKFQLNVRGFYSILIGLPSGGDLICNGVGLETRRISSLGSLSVYRYQRLDEEGRALRRNTIAGAFFEGFEGKPGHYDLKIEVVSDTGCLDASKPRLYIIASNDGFYRWNNYCDNTFWISCVLGFFGSSHWSSARSRNFACAPQKIRRCSGADWPSLRCAIPVKASISGRRWDRACRPTRWRPGP